MLIVIATVCVAQDAAAIDGRSRTIRPGLRLIRVREPGPVRAFVLSIRPSILPVDVALGANRFPSGGKTVPAMARAADAIAAVNGDMGIGRPARPFAEDGDLVQTRLPGSAVMGFAADGRRAFIGESHIKMQAMPEGGDPFPIGRWNNGPPKAGEIAGFTAVGGSADRPASSSCTARLVPVEKPKWAPDRDGVQRLYRVSAGGCRAGTSVKRDNVVVSARSGGRAAELLRRLDDGDRVTLGWTPGWPGVLDIHGGIPLLLRNRNIVTPRPCRTSFCYRQPRTGVGITRGCKDTDDASACRVLFVVVDGRRAGWSVGVTLPDFARLFRKLGAVSAINVDGGGSSVMVVQGRIVNRPADSLRHLPSALVVLRHDDPGEGPFGLLP